MLKIPYARKIVIYRDTIRFCDTLASLTGSGIHLHRALLLCKEVVDNDSFRDRLATVIADVAHGKDLGQAFERMEYFPAIMAEMGKLSDSTGEVDKSMRQARSFLEEELDELVGVVVGALEPVLLLGISVIVVLVLLAMYLPIFNLGNVVG